MSSSKLDVDIPHDAEHKTGSVLAGCMIQDFEQAVTELVRNSIDAGASRIDIITNLVEFSLTVVDNGKGIGPEELRLLGTPCCSSQSLVQGRGPPNFGRKGLSIFALASSSSLHVTSRKEGAFQTWERCVEGCTQSKPILSARQQSQCGTTAILTDFMSCQPVRRGQLLRSRYAHHDDIKFSTLETLASAIGTLLLMLLLPVRFHHTASLNVAALLAAYEIV